MASYQILYWHEIPMQVRARGEGGRASVQLASRFQEAVDQVAMAVGQIGSDEYTAALRWGEAHERDGSAKEVAAAVAAELEAAQPEIDWRAVVAKLRG